MINNVRLCINGSQVGPAIVLERLPLYLRFVYTGDDWKTLDALDQLDDAPKPEEKIVAALRVEKAVWFVDRTVKGRRVGERIIDAVYDAIESQPSDAIMRDASTWRTWCTDEYAKAEGAK